MGKYRVAWVGHMHFGTSEHIVKVNITLLWPFITVQWVEPDKCAPPHNPDPDQSGTTATTHLLQSSVTEETK